MWVGTPKMKSGYHRTTQYAKVHSRGNEDDGHVIHWNYSSNSTHGYSVQGKILSNQGDALTWVLLSPPHRIQTPFFQHVLISVPFWGPPIQPPFTRSGFSLSPP